MSRNPDLGLEVLDFVSMSMQIDDSWSVRTARGFTWWGHRLAQRVSAARKSSRCPHAPAVVDLRSEEHTSELQSHSDLVCRLLPGYSYVRPLPSFPTRLFRSHEP